MSSNFGERIKLIRDELKFSQEELSQLFGMTRSHWSGLETGRISPSILVVCSISLVFDVYADWLVLGEGEAPDVVHIHENIRNLRLSNREFHKMELIDEDKKRIYLDNFIKRLRLCRKKLNLTQDDVNKKFGIARSSYVRIEKGESNVNLEALEVLLKGMDVSADWLLFGIEPYQKGILYPMDIFVCKNEEEVRELYQEKLSRRSGREIQVYQTDNNGQKFIPYRNLTQEQLNIVMNLILEFERKNSTE